MRYLITLKPLPGSRPYVSKNLLIDLVGLQEVIMTFELVLLATVFCFGYLAIVFEHNIHVDKTASALLTAVLC